MNFFSALKIGYKVLGKVEELSAAGVLPVIKIKGIPMNVIDQAASQAAKAIIDAHKAASQNTVQ